MAAPIGFKAFHAQTGGDVNAFQRYLTHYANMAAQAGDASLSPVKDAVGLHQSQHLAQQAYAPLIKQTNSQYGQWGTNLEGASRDYGVAMQKYLAPIPGQVRDTYNAAQAGMSGATSNLTADAQGAGVHASQALSNFAALSGQPVASQQAQMALDRGNVAGNVIGQQGTGMTNQLVNEGEAAALFHLAQPETFARFGTEELGRSLGALGEQRANAVKELQGKVPSLTGTLYNSFLNRELQKAVARQLNSYRGQSLDLGYYKTDTAAKTAAAAATAKANAAATKAAAAKTKSDTHSKEYGARQRAAATRAASMALKPFVKVPKANPNDIVAKPDGTLTVAKPKRAANFAQAYATVVRQVTPYLKAVGLGGDGIRAWVLNYMAPYYQPGQYGRPGLGPAAPNSVPHDLRPGG